MLNLYATAMVSSDMMRIDSLNYFDFDREWFNTPEAVYCIEHLDGNKNIGDGVSDSPWLGIIPPSVCLADVKQLSMQWLIQMKLYLLIIVVIIVHLSLNMFPKLRI